MNQKVSYIDRDIKNKWINKCKNKCGNIIIVESSWLPNIVYYKIVSTLKISIKVFHNKMM